MNILTPIAASVVLACVAIQGDLSAQRPDSDLRQQIRRIVREEVKRALAEIHKTRPQAAARRKARGKARKKAGKKARKQRRKAPSAAAALERANRALAEARRALAEAQRALRGAQVPKVHMPKVHMPTLQLPRVHVRTIVPKAQVRTWVLEGGQGKPFSLELAPKAKKKGKRPKARKKNPKARKKKRKNKKRTGRIV